jgi:D-alanyl-D-alanine carboxypeptidase (penicillin-binding protein 5/6)
MNRNSRSYFNISIIILASFFVCFFNPPKKVAPVLKTAPSALANFNPSTALPFYNNSKNTIPERDWSTPALELEAQAALAMRPDATRVYYNKNMEVRRPVASLTKLMTAIVVLENFNLDDVVKIAKSDVKREGASGDLRQDETLTVRSLLNIMLIDSSNDAATALARQRSNFISMMNEKVEKLGLTNTHFSNADGLDEKNNFSSALDIAKVFSYLVFNHPFAGEILKTKNMVVYSAEGGIEHRLENTNKLLENIAEIQAGKTGYTGGAGESLTLLISGMEFGEKNSIITVVLGSPDRFGESEKLINWLKSAYIWK